MPVGYLICDMETALSERERDTILTKVSPTCINISNKIHKVMCKLFVREFVSYVSNQYIYIYHESINSYSVPLPYSGHIVVVNEFY